MKWHRLALACAAVLTALALTALTTMTAKATTPFINAWSNTNTGKCLGVLAANMTNGTPVVQWACDDSANQQWEIATPNVFPANNFVTQIRDFQNTNKCLGVLASATGDGANLVIWDCNGSLDQQWDFQQVAAPSVQFRFGCYTIANVNAFPKVLGILAASPADGAQAVIWDNLGHPDQVWCPLHSNVIP
jgi:hypothetical protein